MAIRTVVTRGYGNGTFLVTIPLVVSRGYVFSTVIVLPSDPYEDSLVLPYAPGQFLTIQAERYHEAATREGLYSTCILQTETQLQDGQGGFTSSFLNSYLNVPCRLMSGTAGTGKALDVNSRAMLTLLASQVVTEDMRAWIDGRIYEIEIVRRPSTFSTVQRVVVRRVGDGDRDGD